MRIGSYISTLPFFYGSHPYISFYRTIWNLSERDLENYYGKFAAITNARLVSSQALYITEWVYFPLASVADTIGSDESNYYWPLPLNMLPVSTRIFAKYGGSSYYMLDGSRGLEFIDYRGWFALKMPKSLVSIVDGTISFLGEDTDGFWIYDFVEDVNMLELHFGELLGIKVNRNLYQSLKSSDTTNKYYSPSIRVLDIHEKYATMMREIVSTMMINHPSPSNIKKLAKLVVGNYGFLPADNVAVVDRVSGKWSSIGLHSLFVIYADILESAGMAGKKFSSVFSTIAKVVEYFKPVFTRAIVAPVEPKVKDEEFSISDTLSFSKGQFNASSYETKTRVAPTMTAGLNLETQGSFSALTDKVAHKFIQNYTPGEINVN